MAKRLIAEFRSFVTPELFTVLVVSTITVLAAELLTPILPLYLAQEGVTVRDIGLMSSLMIVAIAISEVSWGWLIDRINVKIALYMSTFAAGLATAVFLIGGRTWIFFLAFFLFGFYRPPIWITGRWYMGVHAPPHMKATAFGILSLTWGLTQGLTGIASGYISQAWGYRITILFSALILVISGVVLFLASRRLNFQTPKAEDKVLDPAMIVKRPSALREVLAVTLLVGLMSTVLFVSFGVINTYLPLLSTEVVGTNTRAVGFLFSLRGWVSALLVLPMTTIADQGEKMVYIPIALLAGGLGMFVMGMGNSLIFLTFAMVIFALGMGTFTALAAAIISERISPDRTGLAMGIYGLMEDLGWMVGPAVGGFLWNSYGPQSPFIISGVACVVVLFPYLLFTRKRFSAVQSDQAVRA